MLSSKIVTFVIFLLLLAFTKSTFNWFSSINKDSAMLVCVFLSAECKKNWLVFEFLSTIFSTLTLSETLKSIEYAPLASLFTA